jgi:hypothetical protein
LLVGLANDQSIMGYRSQGELGGKFVWTDTFVKQGGQWKVVASQITPVLEK